MFNIHVVNTDSRLAISIRVKTYASAPLITFLEDGAEGSYVDGLMQMRRNSSASPMELRLFCIKPWM